MKTTSVLEGTPIKLATYGVKGEEILSDTEIAQLRDEQYSSSSVTPVLTTENLQLTTNPVIER